MKHVLVAHDCQREQHPDEPHLTEAVLVSVRELRNTLRPGLMGDVDAGYLALDYVGLLE